MADERELSVKELAEHVGGRLVGPDSVAIVRVASLEAAGEKEIAYVEDAKHFDSARASQATCLIVPENFEFTRPGQVGIVVSRPKLAFARIAALLHPQKRREPEVHSTAVIAASANVALNVYVGPGAAIGDHTTVGAGTRIEAGVVIGDNVTIGVDCVLHPNVSLYDDVTIGDRVVLHAGVCIGADGFGYVRDDMGYHKFPQIGTVVIEDDVELGAYTCVDRGALGRTRIGRGTKIDNLVQVGHNVDIGERVVIASQTGISGSVIIEDDCVIGGQVGFGDHIRVQSGAVIGSKAGILPGKIVRPGVWWGVPIIPLAEYKRRNAYLGRLPELLQELKELQRRLDELERK